MRVLTASMALLVPLAMASLSSAQERERPRGPNPEMRQKMIEKFDKDGDGKLNEEERAAAREFMQERRARRDGEGGPPWARDGERPQGPNPEMRQKMIEKFDKDGDGKLNEEERAAARKFMQERRAQREGKPPWAKEGQADKPRRGDGPKAGGPRGDRPRGDGPQDRVGPPGGGPPDFGRMFKRFDADGDGKIDRKEFIAGMGKLHQLHARGNAGPRGPQGGRQFGPPEGGPPQGGPQFAPGDGPRHWGPPADVERGDRPGPPEGRHPRLDQGEDDEDGGQADRPRRRGPRGPRVEDEPVVE